MAILIRGKTRCRLCDEVIAEGDGAITFPSGLFDPIEPAFSVNDAAVHVPCLSAWEHGATALVRRAEYVRQADQADQ